MAANEPAKPWTTGNDSLCVDVCLTPKSSVDAIGAFESFADGKTALRVRVRATPEKGKANAALLATLAAGLRLPKSAVSLEGGGKSRHKRVRITGDPLEIASTLQRFLKV